jgi:Spy/CpxP family protein refolding chaperone
MKRTVLLLTLIALLGLIAAAASAQPAARGQRKGWMAQLTPEQRTQLQAKIKEMRTADAKPEEIKTGVAELCKGWGLEPPPGRTLLMLGLTQDQRKQLQAKIKEMRAADAKPEEIRAAVAEMLTGWGLEAPARGQGQGNRAGANLTAEQRTQLQAKIKDMRAAGAKPEEIKAAAAELYKGWGLEPPQAGKGGKGGEGRGAMKGPLQNLTEDQRQQVLTKMDELKKAGSTPEEIRRTIREMIQGFGDKA